LNKKTTVAVGLSGGVDSSVAAAILTKKGYNVIGLTMKIWDGSYKLEETGNDACFGPGEAQDIELASEVCKKLGIEYKVFDLSKEYKQHVIEYFKDEYLQGRTPNPCVMCNHKMKFGFLINKAKEAGVDFDYFATGHYAKIKKIKGEFFLSKSTNIKKDQTYFLSGLEKNQLSNLMFPLGDLDKSQVREMAAELGFEVAERKDSQDFITGGDYSPLFKENETTPGEIVNDKGEVLGQHKGIIFYTVGQRKGLGISALNPLYVSRIDAKNNRVIVSDNNALFSENMFVKEMNYFQNYSVGDSFKCKVKIRQKHEETPAEIKVLEKDRVEVKFEFAQRAVTPGQVAVFYDNDLVLASGLIEKK